MSDCPPRPNYSADDTPLGDTTAPLNPTLVGKVLELEIDFEDPELEADNISTSRRPDAISLDYKTAFSLGPVALGDISAGEFAFVWRIRVDNVAQQVFIALATPAGFTESLLFSFTGDPIDEIDLSFDQNSNTIVCAERVGHVWLYWFDPLLGSFAFEDFGEGHSPRVILDDPDNVASSDILLFYVSETNSKISFRVQSEAFTTVHDTPIDFTGYLPRSFFLEDVVKAIDTRLHVIYSRKSNLIPGRFDLLQLESALYPVPLELDASVLLGWDTDVGGTLITVVIVYALDEEGVALGWDTAAGGTLLSPIIIYAMDEEGVQLGWDTTTGGTLVVVLLTYAADEEGVQLGWDTTTGGTLLVVVILYAADEEGVQLGWDTRSGGTLA